MLRSLTLLTLQLSLCSLLLLFLHFGLLLLQVLQSRLWAGDPGIVGQLGCQRHRYTRQPMMLPHSNNSLAVHISRILVEHTENIFSGSHLESRFLLWWWFLFPLLCNVLLFLLAVTFKQVVATVVFHWRTQNSVKAASLCTLLSSWAKAPQWLWLHNRSLWGGPGAVYVGWCSCSPPGLDTQGFHHFPASFFAFSSSPEQNADLV